MKINRLRFSFVVAVAAVAAFTFGAGHAHAQAVTLLDGGFEATALPANSYAVSGGVGWSVIGSAFVISNDYGSSNTPAFGNTPFGKQYLSLDTTNTVDSQTLSGFTAGTTYTFSAAFADLQNGATPALTLAVSGVATASGTFTTTQGGFYGSGTIPFKTVSLTFTALTSGSGTVSLRNVSGQPGDAFYPSVAVDNVTLSAVPEPTPAAAVLLGAGGLAFVAFRRRTRLA